MYILYIYIYVYVINIYIYMLLFKNWEVQLGSVPCEVYEKEEDQIFAFTWVPSCNTINVKTVALLTI